jgi:hypothetical protein
VATNRSATDRERQRDMTGLLGALHLEMSWPASRAKKLSYPSTNVKTARHLDGACLGGEAD